MTEAGSLNQTQDVAMAEQSKRLSWSILHIAHRTTPCPGRRDLTCKPVNLQKQQTCPKPCSPNPHPIRVSAVQQISQIRRSVLVSHLVAFRPAGRFRRSADQSCSDRHYRQHCERTPEFSSPNEHHHQKPPPSAISRPLGLPSCLAVQVLPGSDSGPNLSSVRRGSTLSSDSEAAAQEHVLQNRRDLGHPQGFWKEIKPGRDQRFAEVLK